MKNRAKCRLCKSVIESFHVGDRVSCSCGEIAIDGGTQHLYVYANNFANLIRIDDNDNEIIVKVVDSTEANQEPEKETPSKPCKADLQVMLKDMIKSIEALPQHAMTTPVNHYDLLSSLLLISALFEAEA